MNTKAKGSRNERKTIKLLEAQGYTCTKAGGSLGVWDVVAISGTDIKLIQVKTNTTAPREEKDTMLAFRCPANCSKELWVWQDYKRQPLIEVVGQNADDNFSSRR